jgi:uracil-DNA glycosylase family 4
MAGATNGRGASSPLAGCNCKECPYAKDGKPNLPVLYDGTTTSPIGVVVHDAPSTRDVDEGRPLSAQIGDKFDEALESAQLQRDKLLIFTSVACLPKEPRENKEMKKAIDCCAAMRDYYFGLAGDVPRLIMGQWANLAVGFTRPLDGRKGARGFLYER